jgi:hypothetical protein
MIFFIKLHMSLRNFVAIGFNIKERSFFLCLLSLLPRSHGAASWHVRSQKSVTPFDKSFYPPMYHELAHASASWFVHGYHDGWDIAAVVTATPAVQTPAIRLLQSRFPANRWSSMTFCHSILHTLPSNPTNGSPFGFMITMQPLIIITAVRRRACHGCIGASPRFSLNRCMNHRALLHGCVFLSCTWSYQVPCW